jgi:hypothetical protein
VCCGQPLELHPPGFGWYCSIPCAEDQLRAQVLGTLLHSTPRRALSVEEWHDLSSSYATDLATLEQLAVHV